MKPWDLSSRTDFRTLSQIYEETFELSVGLITNTRNREWMHAFSAFQ